MTLFVRAAIAMLLYVGFYLLAAGVVVGLISIAYLQSEYAPTGLELTGMLGVAAAAVVVWAIFPRFRRKEHCTAWERSHCPQLVDLVERTSAKLGCPAPDAFSLIMDVNAFASQRSRFWGLARRSHVGVGLPLLALLREQELAGVVAHEIGHHVASDVRLGPWIYATRRAIERTISNLDGSSYLLHLPFVLYGRLYLRVTASVSRAQEFNADRVAAQAVGREAVGTALYRIEHASEAFNAYFQFEVVPLLDRGLIPPVIDGFRRFLAAPRWRSAIRRSIDERLALPPSSTDTHPTLQERLTALGLSPCFGSAQTGDCLGLIRELRDLEERAIRDSLLGGSALVFRQIEWRDVGELQLKDESAATYRQRLFPLLKQGVETVTLQRAQLSAVADELYGDHPLLSPLARQRKLLDQLPVAIALVLSERGHQADYLPGVGYTFVVNGESICPAWFVEQLQEGTLSPEQWRLRWTAILGAVNAP